MNPPCLPLGLYVKSPLIYLSKFYEQRSSVFKDILRRNSNTSHAEHLTSRLLTIHYSFHEMKKEDITEALKIEEEFDKDYFDKMYKIQETSFNNKAVLDFLDINKTHLPIFITNPPPGFILQKDTYVQLIVYHKIRKNIKNKRNFNPEEKLKDILKNKSFKTMKESKIKAANRIEIIKHTDEFLNLYKQSKFRSCMNSPG